MTGENDQPKRKAGRPPRDWDTLFSEWVKSRLPRRDFLSSKGISYLSGSAVRNTSHWEEVARNEADKIHRQAGGMGSRVRHALVDNTVRPPEADVIEADEQAEAREAVITPVSVDRSSWNRIMSWRNTQATHDWRTSDSIRLHIGLVLKHGLHAMTVTDQKTGETHIEYRSSLKPSDIRQLAMAAADVQRIQRLALGMSTDNIGIDVPSATPDSIDAQVAEPNKPANLFVVQLSKGGKFVTARPRRAS